MPSYFGRLYQASMKLCEIHGTRRHANRPSSPATLGGGDGQAAEVEHGQLAEQLLALSLNLRAALSLQLLHRNRIRLAGRFVGDVVPTLDLSQLI